MLLVVSHLISARHALIYVFYKVYMAPNAEAAGFTLSCCESSTFRHLVVKVSCSSMEQQYLYSKHKLEAVIFLPY